MAALKKPVIRWTEAEWDDLADKVCKSRKNSPDSIVSIANRLQKQFPHDRQRPGILTTLMLKPLVDRVLNREREEKAKADRCEQIEAKLTFFENVPATKEELLRNLTDEELREHFSARFFQMLTPEDVSRIFSANQLLSAIATGDLAAVAVKRIIERLDEPTRIIVQMPEAIKVQPQVNRSKPQTNGKQKKIVVVGMGGSEGRHVRDKVGHLCDLTFIESTKVRKDIIPKAADLVIVWAKFISHKSNGQVNAAVSGSKVYEHYLGTTELIKKIEQVCLAESIA